MIVLDSSVLIDHLRNDPRAAKALEGRTGAELPRASLVTKAEILKGMRSHERRMIRALFASIHWVEVDNATAELAGELARLYRRSHPGVEIPDFIIAATAMRLDGELWTNNIKHFPMFEDLVSPY
ncbi:MAG TPA: type II toxin-antitoxin system VapC family toxin [Mycobacteriales bacterium]|nr:type II toxin-antitoxin system VapC family toxin [Mycobacteriales bacterium]